MSSRQPLNRLRIADLLLGALIGGGAAALVFPRIGWPALLLVPLGSLTQRFSFRSLEKIEGDKQKEITISLELDPKPDDKDLGGGAA